MAEQTKSQEELLEQLRALRADNVALGEFIDAMIERGELLEAIVTNLSICVARIGHDGKFTLSVGGGLSKFGLKDNDLVGVNVFEAYKHVEDKVQRALSGEVVQFIDSGEHDGQPWAFQNWVFPDKWRERGMFNIAMDITDIKETQKQLARVNEELTQFNYRTSHDLIAPLKTIQGYCALIADDLKDGAFDDIGDYNDRILADVLRLEGLVKDILQLSRADYLDEEATEIDFAHIVEAIRDSLGLTLDDGSVSVELALDHTAPLWSSKTRISQMLENLTSNGVKYADPSKDRQFIRIHTANVAPDRFAITVIDNGIGIPEPYQAKVFDMFFRAHGDRSYGSGLGLYLIKKHVERMAGAIELTSSPEGTTIKLVIPNQLPAAAVE